jgi:ATP-binding cassette, subfamily B (MDR/TAP), member 1
LAGTFQSYAVDYSATPSALQTALSTQTLKFVYLAVVEFVTIYTSTVGFIYTGEHITQKFRSRYLAAIMRQNMAYFDQLGAGEITTRITSDMDLIQDGISEKIGLTLAAVATMSSAFVIALVKYWSTWLISVSSTLAPFSFFLPSRPE